MRFYNYINKSLEERVGTVETVPLFNNLYKGSLEQDNMSIEEINELIQKDCKYYLNLIQNKYIFKRGMVSHINLHGKKNVRQNRRPKGMFRDAFRKLNIWLEKNNHVRRDKAVIAANFKEGTYKNMHGNVYYIFPIGKFDYTWLFAMDMNLPDINSGWDEYAVDNFFTHGEEVFNREPRLKLKYPFKDYFTTNKNIYKAWKGECEIWFNCKEYYYFDSKSFIWVDGNLYWR